MLRSGERYNFVLVLYRYQGTQNLVLEVHFVERTKVTRSGILPEQGQKKTDSTPVGIVNITITESWSSHRSG